MFFASQYYNLTLRLPDYQSNHYGKKSVIRMCDIFKLPDGIVCFYEPPDMIIRSLDCSVPIQYYDDVQKNPKETFHLFLHRYNIKSVNADYLNTHEKFSLKTKNINEQGFNIKCTLATAFEINIKTPFSDDDFPIIFQQKYIDMFNTMINNLFENNRDDNIFIAVHWRRGDQLSSRCKDNSDSSVNCEDSQELIRAINSAVAQKRNETDIFTSGKDVTIYIATNEQDADKIMKLRNEGYFLKSDVLYIDDQYLDDDTDVFIMDLLLMGESDLFFYWGNSGVHDMVLRYKKQNLNYNRLLIQDLKLSLDIT